MIELLVSPLVLFLIAIAIGYGFYFLARSVAPVAAATADKVMPYVGGEPFSAARVQPGYHFFYVALFFTIVHVAALVLATAPADALPWAAAGYLGLLAFAVLVLRWE